MNNEIALIADTNFYREIATKLKTIDKIKEFFITLKTEEEKKNIQAFASPFVMLELSSHLDLADRAREFCECAMIGLVEHCIDNCVTLSQEYPANQGI